MRRATTTSTIYNRTCFRLLNSASTCWEMLWSLERLLLPFHWCAQVCTTWLKTIIKPLYSLSIEPLGGRWVTHVFHGKSNSSPLDCRFQFRYTFVICDKLPGDSIFGIDLQKWCSFSYCWDSDIHLFIQRDGSSNIYQEQRGPIQYSTSQIYAEEPHRHNCVVPIKIKGHILQDQVAHFISGQHTKKELDPNIHILDGIYNIKGKSNLYVMGS